MTGADAISGAPVADPETAVGDTEQAHEAVELHVPPAPEFLRLARYAAADAATRAGLGIDAIDDVRLAVSELCTLLAGSGVRIELRFEAGPAGVVVEGRGAPGPELAGESGELAQTLVEAVVDDYAFEVADGRAYFRLVKGLPTA